MIEIKPYSDCTVYGPYLRKDGRQHVVIVFKNGKKTTVSYPKFLIETKTGKYLDKNETVDHVDRDPLNNNESNLQVLLRSKHVKLDIKRKIPQFLICDICKKTFCIGGRKLSDSIANRKRGKSGPYCSRSCAGKASHDKNRTMHVIDVEYECLKERYARNGINERG